jgi:hypothetical protein
MNERDIHVPDETSPTGFAYILASTTKAAPSKKNTSLFPSKLMSLFSPTGKEPAIPDEKPSRNRLVSTDQIQSLVPIERPCYTLVSSTHFYIFTPSYPFPYISNNSSDPYAQYVRAARAQITYDDDPGRYIRLRYKFSLEKINRIVVGPGDQYFVVDYGVGEGSARIVVMIRDGDIVGEIVEAFGKAGIGHLVSRYSAAGIGWWDTAFADSVSLKPGDARNILFNGVDERIEVDYLHRYVESMRSETRRRTSSSSWFPSFLAPPKEEESSPVVKRDSLDASYRVIGENEEDKSGACQLYLLVGLIVPTSGTSDTSSPPVVRSCSLACSAAYIYLLLERYFLQTL